jgi:hypothetical protein
MTKFETAEAWAVLNLKNTPIIASVTPIRSRADAFARSRPDLDVVLQVVRVRISVVEEAAAGDVA